MKRLMLIALVLLAAGVIGGAALGGCAATVTKGGAALPAVAEQVRKGGIGVGTAYGLALERRFHRIHAEVVGLECETCHADRPTASGEIFTVRPAVDVSADSPGAIDRRVCLGCHTGGPGRDVYGARKP